VEQNGAIIAYALNQNTGTFSRVATIASGFPRVMALEFEPETDHLWAVCDDDCSGRSSTLDIAQSGPSDGRFVVTNTHERPGGMANLNNEGFTIAPRAECVNSLKPVFWADDGNTDSHALRTGKLNCTDPASPPPPDSDGDGVPDASDACPQQSAATPSGCPATSAPPSGGGDPGGGGGTTPAGGATDGDDRLTGDAAANTICGLLGNDTIAGGRGNDTLFGDACNERRSGGGNDRLSGDDGNDTLYGAGGRDTLRGGKGRDRLFGGDGDDTLDGGDGKDALDGGRGNDKLTGGKDTNTIKGGAGQDKVSARNRKKDNIDCGAGRTDSASVDKTDRVRGCEKVRRAKR
jgi:hypothetical protein